MLTMQFQLSKYINRLVKAGFIPVFTGFILLLSSCGKDELISNTAYNLEIPKGFPAMAIPVDNQLTVQRVALGKKLFFDNILSRDSSVSCSSCHLPEYGFSDPEQFSKGVAERIGFRQSITLTNVAYNTLFFWDGGATSLELQLLAPIENPDEMDMNMPKLIERLSNHPDYPALFKKAYDREIDPFTITRALAAYERTLISGNSRYDMYVNAGKEDALTESEKRGLEVFNSSRTNCSQCHSGFNFTSFGFENNGLYEYFADSGRARVTTLRSDVGLFKVPTLRNIGVTAPYMHDGSLTTLEQVIEHYQAGGKLHENKSPLITGFQLTTQEKTDLLNFLNSLTDYEFISQTAE